MFQTDAHMIYFFFFFLFSQFDAHMKLTLPCMLKTVLVLKDCMICKQESAFASLSLLEKGNNT